MDEGVPWVFNHTSSLVLATISSCSKKKSLIGFIDQDGPAGGPQQHRILRVRWGFASVCQPLIAAEAEPATHELFDGLDVVKESRWD